MSELLNAMISVNFLTEAVMGGFFSVEGEAVQYEFYKPDLLFTNNSGLDVLDKHPVILKKLGQQIMLDQMEYKMLLRVFFAVLDFINEKDLSRVCQRLRVGNLKMKLVGAFPRSVYHKLAQTSTRVRRGLVILDI